MDRSMMPSYRLAAAMALAVTTVVVVAGGVADSEAARVTADAVRAQGFPCKEPVSALNETRRRASPTRRSGSSIAATPATGCGS
jgi:hypothetical protein